MVQDINVVTSIARSALAVPWAPSSMISIGKTWIPVWGRSPWSAAVLAVTVLVLFGLDFWATYVLGETHSASPHLGYASVLVAAVAFGYLGGAISGLLVGLLLGPGIWPVSDQVIAQDTVHRVVRTVFHLSIGVIFGVLAGLLSTHYERIRRISHFDPNTGLPNGLAFSKALCREIAHGRQTRPLFCLYVDYPTYELVLQSAGPKEAYRFASKLACALVRAKPPNAAIYHVGGGRFATFLRRAREDDAVAVARQLVAVSAKPIDVDDVPIAVDCFCGLASLSRGSRDAWTLSHRAAAALQQAERQGVPIARYEETRGGCDHEVFMILGELRKALEDGTGLSLTFHPLIESITGRCTAVEALIRWDHQEMGPVPPGRFIPVVERTSLIRKLTRWVLTTAIHQCAKWQRDGLDLTIAVNVSSRDVMAPGFPKFVRDTLNRYQVSPAKLELEITETAAMSNPEDSMTALAVLAEMGVHIAIDDFGTGYSSLERLKRLPAGKLKIDQTFIRHLAEDSDDERIVRGSIALAHSMGLKTVAEGVESAATAALLKTIGCDYLQGFHFTPPLPDNELRIWLARHTQARSQAPSTAA